MSQLTIGKVRGLSQLSTPHGIFTITALDHRGSLEGTLQAARGQPPTFEEMVAIKTQMVDAFAPQSSALLLDPIYGAAQAIQTRSLPGGVGLLVSLEASGYESEGLGRITEIISGWGVHKIKLMGAQAVKLLLYYHPESEVAGRQEDLVKHVVEECSRWDIPLFLEPMSYPIRSAVKKNSPEFAAQKAEIVLETARRLVPLGVDILKAEFPTDPAFARDESVMAGYCRELTSIARVPWVLLSAGVDFETFALQTRLACENGASGFLAGRAIWQELNQYPPGELWDFLSGLARARLAQLVNIATTHATPWYERYQSELQSIDTGPDWYKHYAGDARAGADREER